MRSGPSAETTPCVSRLAPNVILRRAVSECTGDLPPQRAAQHACSPACHARSRWHQHERAHRPARGRPLSRRRSQVPSARLALTRGESDSRLAGHKAAPFHEIRACSHGSCGRPPRASYLQSAHLPDPVYRVRRWHVESILPRHAHRRHLIGVSSTLRRAFLLHATPPIFYGISGVPDLSLDRLGHHDSGHKRTPP